MAFEYATGWGWHSCMKVFEYKILLLACKDDGVLGVYSRRFGRCQAKGFTSGPFSSAWAGRLTDPKILRLIARLTVCFQRS